ncbi:MAG: ATP-binding cassette domain-containing protein [bacterium]|nr:ATP-binding cassette domain-containing protein [bacterium]
MNEFEAAIAEGIRYSYTEAAQEKRSVLSALEEAAAYYSGSFKKNAGLDYAKKLTEKVEKSIDRTELIKDSAAYAFGVSLRNAVSSFFSRQEHNAKEEKRFASQTRKHDALIARGKHVEWKVIPKNVYTIESLRDNILTVINRVRSRYEAYLATPVDFAARAEDMVKYLQARESDAVYRLTKSMAKEKAIKLMEEVGIHEPRTRYYQYPFEFSGGMRQRIVIAIALAANPDILICDEPTTALDVTIQAQILELINRLKKERNLSVIFITHDLGVVANMADDIAVMYAGKIIEYGTADDIFYDPRHPYTWALLSSMPDLDTTEKLDAIPGTPPNMIYPPEGDAFADRNKYAMQIDFEQQPPMFKVSDTHYAATWLLHPDAPKVEMPRIITERIARMKKSGGEEHAEA